MAQVTNAFDTYESAGNREDLSSEIFLIDPEETPVVSAIGKRSVSNTKYEWQVDSLPSVSITAVLEGETLSRSATTATTRKSNICQILQRDVTVTGTQLAMNSAGRNDEIAYQIAKMSRALKRDVEKLIMANQASNESAAAVGTARTTATLGALILTNVDKAGDGTNPTAADGTDPRNDGTARPVSETILKAVIKLCYDNADDQPSMIVVDSASKQVISGIEGRASATSVVALPGKADEVNANVSVYIGDFGTYTVHTDRFSRGADGWVLNPEYLKLAQLRPFVMDDIAKIGDAETKMLTWEGGLQVDNELAHGLMADIGG